MVHSLFVSQAYPTCPRHLVLVLLVQCRILRLAPNVFVPCFSKDEANSSGSPLSPPLVFGYMMYMVSFRGAMGARLKVSCSPLKISIAWSNHTCVTSPFWWFCGLHSYVHVLHANMHVPPLWVHSSLAITQRFLVSVSKLTRRGTPYEYFTQLVPPPPRELWSRECTCPGWTWRGPASRGAPWTRRWVPRPT